MSSNSRISQLQKEIDDLRNTLQEKEEELRKIKQDFVEGQNSTHTTGKQNDGRNSGTLPKHLIERYSRQILLADIGVCGQLRLRGSRVLCAGAGALACPAAAYLAGAGVGKIGIIDYDTVDITNIHRQFLHTERDERLTKVESAARKLRSINSSIEVETYSVQLNSQNARQIASGYDVVIDCTDNVPTRYLLNDLCVMLKIPLISGSALKMEGQLTIYGYRALNNDKEKDPSYQGPCYRCLFPTPPPPETVGSCSANGVAGPVPGVIGSLQALETIKYIVGHTHEKLLVGRMLIFDGDDITFRTVKLRQRDPGCAVCSENPTITQLIDYEQFCQSQAKEKDLELEILPAERRISAIDLSTTLSNDNLKQRHLLVDVRNEAEFRMCHIDGSVNYPIDRLYGGYLEDLIGKTKEFDKVTVVCRRGNDSQIVVEKLLKILDQDGGKISDLAGGLHAWAKTVDTEFPIY